MSVLNRERVLGAGRAGHRHLPRPCARDAAVSRAGALDVSRQRRLAACLEKATAAGELRRDDPQLAAEMLLGMLVGYDRVKRLFGMALEEFGARRAARVVDCFLRAYRPEKP